MVCFLIQWLEVQENQLLQLLDIRTKLTKKVCGCECASRASLLFYYSRGVVFPGLPGKCMCVWAAPDPGKPQIEIIAQSALYFLRSNGVVKPKRSINN